MVKNSGVLATVAAGLAGLAVGLLVGYDGSARSAASPVTAVRLVVPSASVSEATDRGRIFGEWARDDLPSAAARVVSAGLRDDLSAVEAVAREWVRQRAPGLEPWLAATSLRPVEMSRVLENVIPDMLTFDLPGALALLEHAPPGRDERSLYAVAAEHMARGNRDFARDWLAAIAQPENQRVVLEVFASAWSESDPQSTAAWMETLPAGQQQIALRQVIANWSRDDPEGAAELITRLPAIEQIEASRGLARRWATDDPAAAAAWIRTFPASAMRDSLVGLVVSAWAARDPALAEAWIAALPENDSCQAAAAEALFDARLRNGSRPESSSRNSRTLGTGVPARWAVSSVAGHN